MPVERGPKLTVGGAIVFGIVSLLLGVGLVVLVVAFAGSESVEVGLGEDTAKLGSAEQNAQRIARDRFPILLASQANARPVWVQHEGTDSDKGWTAFDARSPNRPDQCTVDWVKATQDFVDSCDETQRWPASGEGLLQYDIQVDENGNLVLDLNPDDPDQPEDTTKSSE